MGETGAFAEVTKMNRAVSVEQRDDTSELELVGRVRKVGQSGGRSAAMQDAFETEVLPEGDNAPYALSKHATNFLTYVLPGSKASEQLFRPADVAHIVEALLLARGPVLRKGVGNLNYREGLEVLLSPGSTYASVAEKVFGNTTNAAYTSFLQFARKCRPAFEEGATIEDLIHLSDAKYELEYIERPPEDLRTERQKNIGRQSVVRTTRHRQAPMIPRIPKDTKPRAPLYAPATTMTPPVKRTGPNSPYQYSTDDAPKPRATDDDDPLAWQRDALCSQTDPEAFFPEKGGSTRDAKKICISCDVRDQCLDYALQNDERFGIWGGLSERERRKLKKRA